MWLERFQINKKFSWSNFIYMQFSNNKYFSHHLIAMLSALDLPMWQLYVFVIFLGPYLWVSAMGGQKGQNALVQRVAYFLNALTISSNVLSISFCFFEPIGSLLFNALVPKIIYNGLGQCIALLVNNLVQRVDNCILPYMSTI